MWYCTTVAGRSAKIKGIEDIVGLFINTLPLRVDSAPEETFRQLTARINKTLLSREAYESTSLVEINKSIDGFDGGELFDSVVVVKNYPLDTDSLRSGDSLAVENFSILESTHYNWTLGIRCSNQIDFNLAYRCSACDDWAARQVFRHFFKILDHLVDTPQCRIGELDILSDTEKKQLVTDLNDTNSPFPEPKTLHGLFREQVLKTPGNTALTASRTDGPTTSLSYRETDAVAGLLAAALEAKGVVGGSIIGLLLERSIGMPIAVFGVLKAGAAYLPIVHDYPRDRIDYMLRDSNANVLITSRYLLEKTGFDGDVLFIEDFIQLKDGLAVSAAPEATALHNAPVHGEESGHEKRLVVLKSCHFPARYFWFRLDRVVDRPKKGDRPETVRTVPPVKKGDRPET
ncbi:MAG: AMP-binding protein [bacterium]|nr:AMP-binding protein [bacterium]